MRAAPTGRRGAAAIKVPAVQAVCAAFGGIPPERLQWERARWTRRRSSASYGALGQRE